MDTKEQIGTLEELDVKPGDVVECQGRVYDLVIVTPETSHPRARFCGIGDLCALSRDGEQHQSVGQSVIPHWKLISRAAPKPYIDLTAITTPFALLDKATQDALIAHGGPYQYFSSQGVWYDTDNCCDAPGLIHRVKPGPKRETVTKDMCMTNDGHICSAVMHPNCTITYDTIDGVIDVATYRVVPT